MSLSSDEILAAELKKLAIKSTGKKTGAGLVSWVAGKMPSNACRLELHFEQDPETVLRRAVDLLDEQGEIRHDVEFDSDHPTVSAVIGSGFLGLNPAVVILEMIPQGESGTCVTVFGLAKEGLIKQRAGEKAARKIADLLSSRL